MSHTPKIGAAQKPKMAYDYDAALNMHILGPGEPALSEWKALNIETPDKSAMQRHRLNRVQSELKKRGIAAAILFDPLNIRYATDATNMQLWVTHNAARYCFIGVEGPVIVHDYQQCEHLSIHNPLIDEVRPARSWFYFSSGSSLDKHAVQWADGIAELARKVAGESSNIKIAIDKINPEGLRELEKRGIVVVNGEDVMETARMIKCADEIKAMRCANAACNSAIDVMKENVRPGVSENRLWSYIHAENIARGGEWIETRILAAGPRTNPWFQESSSRPVQKGELLGFDTDLIGPYGVCIDISRTWLVGSGKPSDAQKDLYQRAVDQVRENTALLRPGLTWHDISQRAKAYPPETYRHYSAIVHGVGLCDEYPSVPFPHQWDYDAPLEGGLEEGMVVTAESYVARRDGGEGVKFEEQMLITATGVELISNYPEDLLIE